MKIIWYSGKMKALFLILAIAIEITLLLKPRWLHSDYIVKCDWLVAVGIILTIITIFLQKRINFQCWLLLFFATVYSLTTVQFNEEFNFYSFRIEYFFNKQLSISELLADWLEFANLSSVVLFVAAQIWIISQLFFRKFNFVRNGVSKRDGEE